MQAEGKINDGVHIVDYETEEILAAEEVITVQVALDSGAVRHVTPPSCIPEGVHVDGRNTRNFQAANGGTIKNYGQARVSMKGNNQRMSECIYNVADVTRTLHATGQICDQGYETLHTKHGAVVVPEGALSQFLVAEDVVTKYSRKNGGLYVAEFQVTAPKMQAVPGNTEAGFTRQGAHV